MSLLNGGLVKAKGLSGEDLDWEFIAGITRDEWEIVGAFLGSPDRIGLIAAVADLRCAPVYPLPPEHPLNPASRYDKAAA